MNITAKRQMYELQLQHKLGNCLDVGYSLLEQFPDSVIEFSVLQREVGWAKRRMLVWEVRDY